MSTNYIPSIGSSGDKDGGVWAVSPNGTLCGTKLVHVKGPDGERVLGLKPGWRAATQADLDHCAKVEAERRATEGKTSKPSGGPLAKGG